MFRGKMPTARDLQLSFRNLLEQSRFIQSGINKKLRSVNWVVKGERYDAMRNYYLVAYINLESNFH